MFGVIKTDSDTSSSTNGINFIVSTTEKPFLLRETHHHFFVHYLVYYHKLFIISFGDDVNILDSADNL